MTCKIHLVTDGKGRPLGLVLTGGNAADTSFFQTTVETIEVHGGGPGRPRTRPERVLADKAYTAKANRDYLTGRGIKVTIPERDDQSFVLHDQDSVPSSFDASGTSSNISLDQDVWIIVRATTEGRWYPAARVTGQNWTTQELAIRMAVGKQDIYLYLVSIAQEQPLIDYVKALRIGRQQNVENDNGLSALPTGKVLQEIQVTSHG